MTTSMWSIVTDMIVVIWLSVFGSPFIVVVVVFHSDWYDCCHLTISFQFSFHCCRWRENRKLIVRWQQAYQSLWITTTTTRKGEPKTDSQMTTIIPVTMDHLSLLSWLWSIVTGMIVVIWLSVFSSPFIVVVVVIHSDWYDCCHLTISFQFSFHCCRGCVP
jgi:hypothetical protein